MRLRLVLAAALSLAASACITQTGSDDEPGNANPDGSADVGDRDGEQTPPAVQPDGGLPGDDASVETPPTIHPPVEPDAGPPVVSPDAGTMTTVRVPERHRPERVECDDQRSEDGPFIDEGLREQFDPEGGYVSCLEHGDCTDGQNGRCVGNGHDGWYCTYDQCRADADCGGDGGGACQCGGGWRSDHNVCLGGDCQVDADCGADGFCSPTFGDCGSYSGFVEYRCHTADDECVDDADCGGEGDWGPYCAYNPAAGRWMCADSHCAG